MLNSIPPPFNFIINPYLKVLLLLFGGFRTLPPHNRVVKEQATVALLPFPDHERSQGVDDFLFVATAP